MASSSGSLAPVKQPPRSQSAGVPRLAENDALFQHIAQELHQIRESEQVVDDLQLEPSPPLTRSRLREHDRQFSTIIIPPPPPDVTITQIPSREQQQVITGDDVFLSNARNYHATTSPIVQNIYYTDPPRHLSSGPAAMRPNGSRAPARTDWSIGDQYRQITREQPGPHANSHSGPVSYVNHSSSTSRQCGRFVFLLLKLSFW